MASILPVLLLGLFIQYAPTYSQPWQFPFSHSHEPCVIPNATIGGDFNFNISTMYYMANTNYTVTVSGFGENAMLALSTYFNGSAVGMWPNNAAHCDGVKGVRNMIATEQWTSPATIGASDTVEIGAYVDTMNGTYVKNITLMQINSNTTKPMSTTVYMNTTAGTTRTTVMTTNSAPGINSKPLQAFVCMLLLLVTVPGL